MFIVLLQMQQQLFSGARLKKRPEPIVYFFNTSRLAFPPPLHMDISQSLAVTLKFISLFNCISWRRVRHRAGPAGAAGFPRACQGSHSAANEQDWDAVAAAGCSLCTHLHTPWAGACWLHWPGEQ